MIRTLVVDDVPLARERVIRMLGMHPDIEVVAEAGSGEDALQAVGELRPDLIVLDVAMPDLDGVTVAARLSGDDAPLLLFLTAHHEHALPAFEVEALDYLLKPVTEERLAKAMRRVRKAHAARPSRGPRGLVIADGARTHIVPFDRIDHISAAGHYLSVHADGRSHLTREPIASIIDRLGPDFMRIHRSSIVRLAAISSLVDRRNGDADVSLHDGTVLRVSRTNRPDLDRWLEQLPR